jgi:hypothetical protein
MPTMQGQLFSKEFLDREIRQTEPNCALSEARIDEFGVAMRAIFAGINASSTLNEAQTEQQLLLPVLALLDWREWMPQVNASGRGRASVPDLLLFPDAESCGRGLAERKDARRYRTKDLVLAYMDRLDAGDTTGLVSV